MVLFVTLIREVLDELQLLQFVLPLVLALDEFLFLDELALEEGVVVVIFGRVGALLEVLRIQVVYFLAVFY